MLQAPAPLDTGGRWAVQIGAFTDEDAAAKLQDHLERRYRMDARPAGRLLIGHSSGGWATLWLQVSYPKLFGGTWSTAPDSVTFEVSLPVRESL